LRRSGWITILKKSMHETHMRAAIALARQSVRSGGGPFGAVVVREGIVIGQGTNRVTVTNDPTAHAEILAIREAGLTLNTFRLQDCEIYASCEPCPMCLAAIYWARIERIYYAGTRADAAAVGFDDALIYQEIAKTSAERRLPMNQVLPEEGRAALEAWLTAPDRVPY
jgi:guanine deaminase